MEFIKKVNDQKGNLNVKISEIKHKCGKINIWNDIF